MPQIDWGPNLITQGNSAFITVEFFDSNGNTTTPSAATFNITYTDLSNVSVTESISLTQTGSFFTGTWSSTSATYGLWPWNVTVTGNSTTFQNGQIRIIYP